MDLGSVEEAFGKNPVLPVAVTRPLHSLSIDQGRGTGPGTTRPPLSPSA
jgi:hypothetical protein